MDALDFCFILKVEEVTNEVTKLLLFSVVTRVGVKHAFKEDVLQGWEEQNKVLLRDSSITAQGLILRSKVHPNVAQETLILVIQTQNIVKSCHDFNQVEEGKLVWVIKTHLLVSLPYQGIYSTAENLVWPS